MITVIRRKAKSRTFRAILLIIVFSMTIGGSLFVPGLLRQITQATRALVTVNGYEITPAQFVARAQHEYERVEMFRQQFGEQADMILQMLGLSDPQQMAYQALIYEALVNKAADKIGLPLSDAFIAQQLQNPSFVMQELADIVPFYVLERDGTINVNALNRYLQQMKLTMSDFEEMVENAMKRSTVMGLLQSTAYVSSDEIRARFVQQYTPKNYSVIPFRFDKYIRKVRQLAVADEELKTFFEQENKSRRRYWLPETRTGVVWEFSPEHFNITIPAEDIEAHYKKHRQKKYVESAPKIRLRRILLRVEDEAKSHEIRNKIMQLKQELESDPLLFEHYAREHSQDPQKGDLMPFYTRAELKPVVGTAAFRLTEDGAISDVLKTDEGYELIQRVERMRTQYKPLDAVKSEIEETLKQQRFSDKFKKVMRKKIARTSPRESLDELKKEYKGKETVLKDVKIDDSRIHQELFGLKKDTTTYYVDGGKGIVILLEDINKSHAPAFEAVKDQVKEDWYQHKANQMLNQDLQKAEKRADEKSLEEVAAQFNTSVERIEGLSLEDKEATEVWSKKGYPVAEISAMRYPEEVKSFKKDSEGFLVKFVSESAFDEELFGKKRDEIAKELREETRERLQRGFVASLRRNATIKTSEEFTNIRNA